ncbi:hypothetical protein [Pseudomonas sp.]|nr:hypothetical protein [Pseudomonas sp.]
MIAHGCITIEETSQVMPPADASPEQGLAQADVLVLTQIQVA